MDHKPFDTPGYFEAESDGTTSTGKWGRPIVDDVDCGDDVPVDPYMTPWGA